MTPHFGLATLLFAWLTVLPIASTPARAHSAPLAASSSRGETSAKKQHRGVIEVFKNDHKIMDLALNNPKSLPKSVPTRARIDTSSVKDRLAVIAEQRIIFSTASNTLNAQSKQEGREVNLLPEAQLVPPTGRPLCSSIEKGCT